MLTISPRVSLLITGRFVDAAFKTTADGFEQCYASNFYGHAYLTLLLLKRIMDSQPSRIVCVISFGELLGRLPWEDLKGEHLGTSGIRAYANSKLMFYTWMLELQMRLARTGKKVDVFGTQPGTGLDDATGSQDLGFGVLGFGLDEAF